VLEDIPAKYCLPVPVFHLTNPAARTSLFELLVFYSKSTITTDVRRITG